MSVNTKIPWATHSFSPWIGCTKVSDGCKNCYAETLDAMRFSKTLGGATKENPIHHWGKGKPRYRTAEATWNQVERWEKESLTELKKSEGDLFSVNRSTSYEPPKVFPSLCDWLDDEVKIEWFYDFLKLVYFTPHLNWLLLTKRPENWRSRLEGALEIAKSRGTAGDFAFCSWIQSWLRGELEYVKNIWIGVSVENQKEAEKRIPLLFEIPAVIRFLSVEPLLEEIDISQWLWQLPEPICENCPKDIDCECGFKTAKENGRISIDWLIVGAESGEGRRDCGVKAIIDVAAQGIAAGVKTFVKQDCAFKPDQQGRIPDDIFAVRQWPDWKN